MMTISFLTAVLCIIAIAILAATFSGLGAPVKYIAGILQFAIGLWWIASHFKVIDANGVDAI